MPTKSWIVHRAIGYAIAAAFVAAILSIKDTPGQPTMRFTCDQMRPFLAGLTTCAAYSAWNWVSGTAEETWSYIRFWALSFLLTIMAGLGVLVYSGSLSKEQGAKTLVGITIGAVIGLVRVARAIKRGGYIEF